MTSTSKMQPIDFDSWPRKQHFELFKNFTQPYFNVCVQLNAQTLFNYCKAQNISFFQAYVYCTLKACFAYEPIMLRIIESKPWLLTSIRASVVELDEDECFVFSYFDYLGSFKEFSANSEKVSKQSKSNSLFSDAFANTEGQADLIHISVLPWLNFSAFSHAFSEGQSLGIPKFVFGQYDKQAGTMPLSVDVHHSLMDGLHVARFVKVLQAECDHFKCK